MWLAVAVANHHSECVKIFRHRSLVVRTKTVFVRPNRITETNEYLGSLSMFLFSTENKPKQTENT